MERLDFRDITCGLLLMVVGGFVVGHVSTALELGTVQTMGPGMFPMAVGVLLLAFGLAILIPACFRYGRFETVEWRPMFAVLASLSAFALMVRPFGLLPSIVVLVLIASLGAATFRPKTVLVLCIALPLLSYLIFSLGLGLALTMIRMPF